MSDRREGGPKMGFQQQSGWSLSGQRSTGMKGRTAPGPLPGWAGATDQIREDEDAPISPGTKPIATDDSLYFQDSSPTKPRVHAPGPSIDGSSRISSIAPWESDSSPPSIASIGSYSDAWSEGRPISSRAYTSDAIGSSSAGEGGFRKSVSDRLRQEAHKARNIRQTSTLNPGEKSPGNRKKSATTSAVAGFRSRDPSMWGSSEGSMSLPGSRPKTPSASAEVAPWDFQELTNVPRYGDASMRQVPPMPDISRINVANLEAAQSNSRHKVFGHRKTSSRDEPDALRLQQSATDIGEHSRLASRPSRGNLNPFSRRPTEMLASDLAPTPDFGRRLETRATSPVPSFRSGLPDGRSQYDGPGSSSGKKGGILGRIGRHLHLHDKSQDSDDGKSSVYSGQQDQMSMSTLNDGPLKPFSMPASSISNEDSPLVPKTTRMERRGTGAIPKKESKARLFHRDRGRSDDKKRSGTSDGGVGSRTGDRPSLPKDGTYFDLDTDLNNMHGIVSGPGPETFSPFNSATSAPGPNYFDPQNTVPDQPLQTPLTAAGAAGWDAPDSWGVAPKDDQPDDKASVLQADEVLPEPGDLDVPFCIRIFHINQTSATLALPLRSSVNEVLEALGKKSFLQDDLGNYQIVLRKGELQRQLQPSERPIMIQRRLLQQAGYLLKDHIDKEGQDDNSYLCRFTFVPSKVSGPYSLDRDSGVEFERMSKFNNMDLSGRSLTAIPIVLYKKSSEIVSLNLSRNLALEVPRDFIASCSHLKEIRYTGNEARHLPASFSLAQKLQVLDVSHNEIEQLETADLARLSQLVSLKVANNALTQLPFYFTQFKQLRSLNLSSNGFKCLPNFFGELHSLVDLDISFNMLETWPPVEELVNLERFWATNNNLSGSIPDEYRNLTNLKDIDVRFNNISSIDAITYLPNVEQFAVGHNNIVKFEGFFPRLRVLQADHNPMTRFDISKPMPDLSTLNLASCSLTSFEKTMFEKLFNLAKLNLDKNQFASLPAEIGRLQRLEILTISKNRLTTFPTTIGCLTELKHIDARECNIKSLPAEIWFCAKLEELNCSSNCLDNFPKLAPSLQPPVLDPMSAKSNPSMQSSFTSLQGLDELSTNGDDVQRRPSQASGSMLSMASSPGTSVRKNSILSNYPPGRKQSMQSRQTPSENGTSVSHKDSNSNNRAPTFASSMRNLMLADNRLTDEVFESFLYLNELRVVNLSYNDLDDIPPNVLRRWHNLNELYLSGNALASLPTDDLGNLNYLRILHLNGNKFQSLPAELAKLSKLIVFDVGCNILKYNVANWPFDWNWVWNPNLRYLSFSGNRRLEIKPTPNSGLQISSRDEMDLTSFHSLQSLRTLGLMDVTLTIPHVPDETENRRVRTTGSTIGTLRYGMADSLGKLEHLSTLDLLIPKFRHGGEILVGMFDGQSITSGGSRVARFLQENFKYYFTRNLVELMTGEDAGDALRRTFLAMNRDLITFSTSNWEQTELRLKQTPIMQPSSAHQLIPDDRSNGSVATVLFLQDMELFIANVGNAQAMLIPSDGSYKFLTTKHEPAEPNERERIRQAGGFVSRYGKLNDSLDVSRAFGYAQHMPAVMASPSVMNITLREQDELVLLASKEFWDYVSPDLAVDVARSERDDPMRAAHKLRDIAIAFGATHKLMVMVVGVAGLKKRERSHNRTTLASPMEHVHAYSKRSRKQRDRPDDSTLARLDKEIDAPTGELAMVFTDIKSSTALWEKSSSAMRSGIKLHNELMRRQLRYIGGYEVKTEGDAFMIAFPTPTAALLWCFAVQTSLLTLPWPAEILDSPHGQELLDEDENPIYRGLSVRMGIHWGAPDCEPDPITRRMDYFGPIVNRAARIQGVADGGEITCSSEFISEIERTLEIYTDTERQGSTGSDDTILDDGLSSSIRQNLMQLSEQGFEVKDMGEKKLKGLENPETLFLIYPHALAGRQHMAEARKQAAVARANGAEPASMEPGSKLTNIEPQHVWDMWSLSLRLEMLCSALEDATSTKLQGSETALLERMRSQGGEVSDKALVQFVEHLVCRVETCVNTLTIRNMLKPAGTTNMFDARGPIQDVFSQLQDSLNELEMYRKEGSIEMTEA